MPAFLENAGIPEEMPAFLEMPSLFSRAKNCGHSGAHPDAEFLFRFGKMEMPSIWKCPHFLGNAGISQK